MVYQELAELQNSNRAAALCTIIRTQGSTPRHVGSKMLVYADGSIVGTIGGGEMESRVVVEALQVLEAGVPKILEYSMSDPERGDPGVCGGHLEIFVEPIKSKPIMVIVGAGHVGRAVAYLAKWLGFYVVVTDDRPAMCSHEVLPEADQFYPITFSDFTEEFNITPWTYFVLTTRSVDVDVEGLPAILKSDAAYIGVIGSQRRWTTTKQKLNEIGITDEQISRVKSPIGLALNAETPEEIAVSILAEIIMLKRRDQ
jgi:xanthine dehydrogenase accessory factor